MIAGGKTYAELGDAADPAAAQIADARRTTPPTRRPAEAARDVTGQRETVFKGETLRGLLLTSYGFSEFGAKAAQAATVAYLAAVLLLLSPWPASPTPCAPREARASRSRRSRQPGDSQRLIPPLRAAGRAMAPPGLRVSAGAASSGASVGQRGNR